MNALLQSISDQSSSNLVAFIKEAHDDLLAAIHKAEMESQLQESPLKFNIGYKIVIDFDKSKVVNSLSWNVKQSLESSYTLNDPNQPSLPMDEETVTE